ncbi:MAG TPA: glycosyl hydrolase [Bacteroidia bacterium]|nr:glycosyl hydrolase [Bacteroidia bacterium]
MKFFKTFLGQSIFLCLLSSSLFAQQNICIDSTNSAEELSLALCPSCVNKIAAGSNITNFYSSSDTGRTWHHGTMQSTYGVYGDPTLICDTAGNFYFIHLSNPPIKGYWLDRMVCQKSTDGGVTWNNGSYAGHAQDYVHSSPERNQDKPGAVVDFSHSPYRGHIYLSWTQFDKYDSHVSTDSSHIFFAQSDDTGSSWTAPIRLDNKGGDCLDGDLTDEGAVPCVGPEGEVYVAWAGPNGLVFKKSIDGGMNWSAEEKKITPIIGGWDYDVSGIFRSNGLPMICCDLTNGPYRGTIYIGWSDQRNGSDNTDIWYVKSTDKGETWSPPLRINNDDSHRQQFMTWLSIDPVTGYLYSLFYDRREHGGDTTDVYLAVSKDGGNNFCNFRINDRHFVPKESVFFGDYIDVVAYNNIVRPMWMQLYKYKLCMYTAIINPGDLDWALYTPPGPRVTNSSCEIGGNNESIWFTYNLENMGRINLSVIDMQGKQVYGIYNNWMMKEGPHEYLLNTKKVNLKPGVYAYKLEAGENKTYKTFLVY